MFHLLSSLSSLSSFHSIYSILFLLTKDLKKQPSLLVYVYENCRKRLMDHGGGSIALGIIIRDKVGYANIKSTGIMLNQRNCCPQLWRVCRIQWTVTYYGNFEDQLNIILICTE